MITVRQDSLTIFYSPEMLLSLTSAGAAHIPDLYKPAVTASLARPRPGVEVTVCTESHLVELCQGLVVRSLPLPLRHNKKVVELRLVQGSQMDWRYLLVRENSVEFRSVASLALISQHQAVQRVEVGDFKQNGRRLVKLFLGNGEAGLKYLQVGRKIWYFSFQYFGK